MGSGTGHRSRRCRVDIHRRTTAEEIWADTDGEDEVLPQDSDTAVAWARRAAREEGLLVGISSGAALAAAGELWPRLLLGANWEVTWSY